VKQWSVEHWGRISPYLDQALDLPTADREHWLADLNGSDPDLADELRELLAQHQANGASQFLEQSPLRGGGEDKSLAGQQIGAYTLEALLGRGGMGSVWCARRSDGHFEGRVAIKILDRRGLGPKAAEQIRHEASLLARLSHPNIARLFDAGIHDDGRPFLILEYVEGERIDHYCRSRQLTLAERLRLFLPVLEAAAHAHAQHIVHRDLKPSNILVTGEGVAKLLDFGVASLQQPTPLGIDGTAAAQEPLGMTLGYAAPEQIRGDAASPASDVYALGILLHVLLTERHPHGADGSTPTQLVRATLTSDTKPASESIDTAASRRWVRGDLDSIMAKATHREAALRYTDAGQLAADIGCFLEGRPVRARERALAYRAGLFIRRLAGWLPGVPDAQRRLRAATLAIVVLLLAAAGATLWKSAWNNGHRSIAAEPAEAFAPPPHSIAVLPFVNLSGEKEQKYFSDGLTEELLSSLAEIDGLQVAARTSSFSFKEHADIATVAHKLNVGAVLEGSVRRSANTVRITAQLINAVTGFHLWSKTYDRNLGDVLRLQTEIATAVAGALKVTLLGDVSARIELGGTHNAAAFDAYLRGAKAHSAIHEGKDLPTAIAAYTEAIRLDPHYALAFAARSLALSDYTALVAAGAATRQGFDKAHADARQALSLAPDLAEANLASGNVSEYALDFAQTSDAYERALALAPGNAVVLRYSGFFAVLMGHTDAGLAALRHAVVLDPLARGTHGALGQALYFARRYEEAVAAYAEAISLEPEYKATYGRRGFAYFGLGDLQSARASCETKPDYWVSQQCLAVIYDKLGRHADAEAVLAKQKASQGDTAAYQYATIYAQWGDRPKALEWLETALRLHDTGLEVLKTDPLLDPLRKEPRFQAIERELKFPN
jgi:eukaryotic-like serine/threonine-protein kinase